MLTTLAWAQPQATAADALLAIDQSRASVVERIVDARGPTLAKSSEYEILPQGSTFGSTATMVYVGTIAFNTVSTTAKINPASNEISVQARDGGANLATDVVGYFAAPSGNGGKFFEQGGNAFGTTATIGTTDNQALSVLVDNQPTLRLAAVTAEDTTDAVNVINGSPLNTVDPGIVGATISGGGATFEGTSAAHHVTGFYGTIGGGFRNSAGGSDTVAGKAENMAKGGESSVGGGIGNIASVASANVSGGNDNVASGFWSAVGGGQGNGASGDQSTVPGGRFNTASGASSFAAGNRAKATTDGSFIWADSQDFDFQPSVDNFFGVRATGGVGFTVAINPTNGAVTQFCNLLPGTPSWQCTSDRNAKENFVPVDGMDVLARVVAMPISTWNFKGADPSLRAIGPTAQDFYAAFHLGNDDKSIATSNLAGVALAAIQGLYQTMRRKDDQIAAQGQAIARLTGEVAAMRGELDRAMRTLTRNGTLR
ncbi:MAG TPA: tail fiber domain-containing protein [Casimicrobiaceae bacterium]|nr:tail fiber domain-containing protein [Casimicrobiaceae bacterium]